MSISSVCKPISLTKVWLSQPIATDLYYTSKWKEMSLKWPVRSNSLPRNEICSDLLDLEPWWVARKYREQNKPVMSPREAIQRQANRAGPQPFCSTIRISIKVSRVKDSSQQRNDRRFRDQTIEEYEFAMDRILISNIRVAFREFLAFFYRHRIQICFAGSITDLSLNFVKPRIERPVFNTFIKNYSWQMLSSIGYRFQQRVSQQFIEVLKTIETDSEFYQVRGDSQSVARWSEWKCFVILDDDLHLAASERIPFSEYRWRIDEVFRSCQRNRPRKTCRTARRVTLDTSTKEYGLCPIRHHHANDYLRETV